MKAMRLLGALLLLLGLNFGLARPANALTPDGSTPDASHCTAAGTGIVGGAFALHKVDIVIQAKDLHGNLVVVGGATFKVTVAGPALGVPWPVHVTDNANGTYSAHYVPLLPGTYTVTITLGGTNIQMSPFHPVFTLF